MERTFYTLHVRARMSEVLFPGERLDASVSKLPNCFISAVNAWREDRLRAWQNGTFNVNLARSGAFKMPNAGRNERLSRVTQHKSGAWGTVSQDLLQLAAKPFRLPKDGPPLHVCHKADRRRSGR